MVERVSNLVREAMDGLITKAVHAGGDPLPQEVAVEMWMRGAISAKPCRYCGSLVATTHVPVHLHTFEVDCEEVVVGTYNETTALGLHLWLERHPNFIVLVALDQGHDEPPKWGELLEALVEDDKRQFGGDPGDIVCSFPGDSRAWAPDDIVEWIAVKRP